MQSDRPVVDYQESGLVQPSAQVARPWVMKSAGEVGARICFVGFPILGAAMLLKLTWAPVLMWVLFVIASAVCLIGGIVSVIGMFEPPEVRSHVAVGCFTSLVLGLALVAFVMFGMTSLRW